jgi:two-component system chemotaxis response regulator CheY
MAHHILIVDDSAAMRKILPRVLHQTGMAVRSVSEAGDGLEVLEIFKSRPIHLVLSDINMPRMDGLQWLAAVKASPGWKRIPVVRITTEGGETKVGEAVRLGAKAYVRKPFTGDRIKEKLCPPFGSGRATG